MASGGPTLATGVVDVEATTPVLLVTAGVYRCALPVAQVIETLRALPVQAVTGSPPFLRGLALLRGVPTPVIDLGLLLGDVDRGIPGRFIRLRANDRIVALAVATVDGVHDVAASTLQTMPAILQDPAADAVALIGGRDRQLLLMLQTVRLMPSEHAHLMAAGEAAP